MDLLWSVHLTCGSVHLSSSHLTCGSVHLTSTQLTGTPPLLGEGSLGPHIWASGSPDMGALQWCCRPPWKVRTYKQHSLGEARSPPRRPFWARPRADPRKRRIYNVPTFMFVFAGVGRKGATPPCRFCARSRGFALAMVGWCGGRVIAFSEVYSGGWDIALGNLPKEEIPIAINRQESHRQTRATRIIDQSLVEICEMILAILTIKTIQHFYSSYGWIEVLCNKIVDCYLMQGPCRHMRHTHTRPYLALV